MSFREFAAQSVFEKFTMQNEPLEVREWDKQRGAL
jgi:hypothetical protein